MRSIAICSDHAGYELKTSVINYLTQKGYEVEDFGTNSTDSCDYADYAHPMADSIEAGKHTSGISICGSGNGINITVNKHQGIRSALCWNAEISKLAREHNNANVCALPARFISEDVAFEIIDLFLETAFEGGRHQLRIDKIPVYKCK